MFPFFNKEKFKSSMFLIFSLLIHLPTTAELSNALDFSQGYPNDFKLD